MIMRGELTGFVFLNIILSVIAAIKKLPLSITLFRTREIENCLKNLIIIYRFVKCITISLPQDLITLRNLISKQSSNTLPKKDQFPALVERLKYSIDTEKENREGGAFLNYFKIFKGALFYQHIENCLIDSIGKLQKLLHREDKIFLRIPRNQAIGPCNFEDIKNYLNKFKCIKHLQIFGVVLAHYILKTLGIFRTFPRPTINRKSILFCQILKKEICEFFVDKFEKYSSNNRKKLLKDRNIFYSKNKPCNIVRIPLLCIIHAL